MTTSRKRAIVATHATITMNSLYQKVEPSSVVKELFHTAGISSGTITKGGWCLQEGMTHVLKADQSGQLVSIVRQRGLPSIYDLVDESMACRHEIRPSKPQNCFQALCRIISGQQLAGTAARAIWDRLNNLVSTTADCDGLTPGFVYKLAKRGIEEHLQKPAGLSRAKALSIVALAEAFENGELTDDFFTSPTTTEVDIRHKLLSIKGIGPWTCDMFLMFYLEKGNVLPVGDLGVRKGIAKFFGMKGRGPKGSLCQIKDRERIDMVMAPYYPFQSLVTYYMWAVADAKDFYKESNIHEFEEEPEASTPKRKRTRRQGVATP